MGARTVWWEVSCPKHGKTEVNRPNKEKVVAVGVPVGVSPRKAGGCPICATERNKTKQSK